MKKRFMLTLDADNFALCQKNIKELGMPPATLSVMINDMLPQISNMLQVLIDKRNSGKQLTFQDVMAASFEQLGKAMSDDEGK